MIEVEKDIPVRGGSRRYTKYPFPEMDVGDSFAVPVGDELPSGVQRRVGCSATNAGKRLGRRFTTRQVREGGELVVRCWRVS